MPRRKSGSVHAPPLHDRGGGGARVRARGSAWAICTAALGAGAAKKKSAKFERCVVKVKARLVRRKRAIVALGINPIFVRRRRG